MKSSLLPFALTTGGSPPVRDQFVSEHWFDNDRIPKSEGVRTNQWKYFRYVDHPEHEELYDLEHDPQEMSNLAGESAYGERLQEMRELLESSMERL
ncbi:MAG: sulfatase/phosphatase domain-containing protein [Bacteroidota bacterium]